MDDATVASRQRQQQQPASPATTTKDSRDMMAELDAPLHALGFEMEELSPSRLTGRLPVTRICCQASTPALLLLATSPPFLLAGERESLTS
jgi:hypothetical protein